VVSDLMVLPYTENAAPTPVDPPQAAALEPPEAPAPPQDTHSHPENILRVDAGRVDAVLNLVGELIISKSMFHQAILEFSRRFPKDPLRGRFADVMAHQTRVLNDLQRSVMKIRMVPVEQLFRRFPRVIRDVSKTTGKDVKLVLRGENTDLDKSILDALAEPLTHLVRNGVDHGIEPPEVRVAAGKPAQGVILLNAYHQANHVVVEISDDGRGIDAGHIAEEALAKGIVTKEQLDTMGEPDFLQLIFEPGFSTAQKITEVSGRGVGLDVVKTVLEQLKGTVSVHTRPGEGTTFQLRVPLTLAIIKALLFRVGGRAYAVPLGNVLEITRANAADIHRVDNHEVLRLREEVLTLVPLDHLVGQGSAQGRTKTFIVVVALAGRKFGLMVDQLLGEEELVIKPLDSDLVSSDLVSGASIMGDGSVVLVINVPGVVEKSGKSRSTYIRADSAKKRMGRNMGAEA
jgi:two-component system chemotaxis sensor kinase CheA